MELAIEVDVSGFELERLLIVDDADVPEACGPPLEEVDEDCGADGNAVETDVSRGWLLTVEIDVGELRLDVDGCGGAN